MGKRRATVSLADQAERRLVMQAVEKARRGESLTTREQRALRGYEKTKEEEDRWRYYESIPKRHWSELSGRQNKVINEQADRYGVPLRGRTINLRLVARWLHDFLAANAHKLLAADEELLSAESTPALERLREAKADLAEMELKEKRGSLVPREEIHEGLVRLAARLRQFGETLQRDFGADAHRLLEELLDDYQREVDRLSGDDSNSQHVPV